MTENQPTVKVEGSRPPHVNLQSTLEDPEIEERIKVITETLDEIQGMIKRSKRAQECLQKMKERKCPADDIKCARRRIINQDHSIMRRLDDARMSICKIRRRQFLKWNIKFNPHIEERALRCHQMKKQHRRDRYDVTDQ
jgi:hypothetical protein